MPAAARTGSHDLPAPSGRRVSFILAPFSVKERNREMTAHALAGPRRAIALRERLDQPTAGRRRDPGRAPASSTTSCGSRSRRPARSCTTRARACCCCGGTGSSPTPGAGRSPPVVSSRARRSKTPRSARSIEETGWRPGPAAAPHHLPPDERRRPTRRSTCTSPTARPTSAIPSTRTKPNASSGCRSRRCASCCASGAIGDGMSVAGLVNRARARSDRLQSCRLRDPAACRDRW